jgi:hypothetical protein
MHVATTSRKFHMIMKQPQATLFFFKAEGWVLQRSNSPQANLVHKRMNKMFLAVSLSAYSWKHKTYPGRNTESRSNFNSSTLASTSPC